MNANETLEIISKTWCNTNDLMKLTGLSKRSALKIKAKIKNNLNFEINTKSLPMNIVVDYLKIDINYLKMLAPREEEKCENNK